MKTATTTNHLNLFSFTLIFTGRLFGLLQKKLSSQLETYKSVLENLAAVLFLGTIFVTVSYIFFYQLAEYGW